MAKAKIKEEKPKEEKSSNMDGVLKKIRKDYGEIIKTGTEILTFKKSLKTVSLSPMFDSILKGGIREGTWLNISGRPKGGKTTTLMQLAYNCQKEGRPVIYINSEGRLSEMNFDVEGLDPEKMMIITAEDKPISAEVFLDIALQLISLKENEGALCIIDSVSSLIPSKELEEDVTGSMRPGLPKILSNFVKKAGQIVPNNKIIMGMVTHMITNTGGQHGSYMMADSGVKIQYQSDTKIEIKSVEPWVNSKEAQIGQAVTWKISWSSLGITATECKSWIRYGKGIDFTQELLTIAEDVGLIDKAGAWYNCVFLTSDPLFEKIFPGGDPEKAAKFQGIEKTYKFLDDNKDVLELLHKKVKELT